MKNPITNIFTGIAVERIVYQEKGKENVKDKDVEFGSIKLEAANKDLYKAFESFTHSELEDYQTSTGLRTSAKSTLRLKHPPKVLNFYINRIVFDLKKLEAYKVNTPFSFEREIYLDKFMADNGFDPFASRDEEIENDPVILSQKIEKLEKALQLREV